ncbi:MAG: ATP-binding protein [Synergistaceae bacterium]|nr:ATP-binding protein [Synergistaceae bacterium]
MKFVLENVGPLRRADIELGDITVICGENNTGKTYATCALYGFLKKARQLSSPFEISDAQYSQLFQSGKIAIRYEPEKIVSITADIFSDASREYSGELHDILACSGEALSGASVRAEFSEEDFAPMSKRMNSAIHVSTDLSTVLNINVRRGLINIQLNNREHREPLESEHMRDWISDAVTRIFIKHLFPDSFIASVERTGIEIFRDEISLARDSFLEDMINCGRSGRQMKLPSNYPLSTRDNLKSLLRFKQIRTDHLSPVAMEHPKILTDFADIIGGEYIIDSMMGVRFKPASADISLSITESSSSVRSLLLTGLYIKHIANFGNLLIVDKPEMNLHPNNQRRIARLFARLANAGVRVLITTHSDYILKEFDALVLLKQNAPRAREILEREGYDERELLKPSQIRLYTAEKAQGDHEGGPRCVLSPSPVSNEAGVASRSFDKTIDDMNRLFDEIAWGK